MSDARFKLDLKQIANSALVHNLSDQINQYEKRVRALVKDFDHRSRTARERSRVQLDRFATQLKRTRTDLEKRVATLINSESRRLNQGVHDIVGYLKHVANHEKVAARTATLKRATTRAASLASRKKPSAKRAKKASSKSRSRVKSEPVATA